MVLVFGCDLFGYWRVSLRVSLARIVRSAVLFSCMRAVSSGGGTCKATVVVLTGRLWP